MVLPSFIRKLYFQQNGKEAESPGCRTRKKECPPTGYLQMDDCTYKRAKQPFLEVIVSLGCNNSPETRQPWIKNILKLFP